MQKRTRLAALIVAALGLPLLAAQQFPQTLPANSVLCRLGISPGPAQACPFSTVFSSLFSTPGLHFTSPVLDGDPKAPTASPGDNDTSIATTAFVTGATTYLDSGTGAVSRTLTSKLGDFLNAADFGLVCDNDAAKASANSLAISRAITAAVAQNRRTIYFPYGTCAIASSIDVTSPIVFQGQGQKSTVIRQTDSSASGIRFLYPGEIPGGGVKDLTIEAGAGWLTSGFTGAGSSGIGLVVQNINGNFTAQNFAIYNYGYGVIVTATTGSGGAWGGVFTGFDVRFIANSGIQVNCNAGADSGGDRYFSDGVVSNNGYAGGSVGVGMEWCKSGGDHAYTIDITSFGIGVKLSPANGSDNMLYTSFRGVLSDTSAVHNWVFDGTNGKILGIQLVDCWSGFSTDTGVVFTGANIDDVQWTGGKVRESGTYGIELRDGSNIRFNGASIAANSRLHASPGNYPGVQVSAGVSNFMFVSNNIGNFASGTFNQGDGIVIASGASDNFIIVGNNLLNAGSGKTGIVNGASGTNACVRSNLGSTVTVTTGTGC
jgi:hypothetical protein